MNLLRHCQPRRLHAALSRIEVLVIIAIIGILAGVFLIQRVQERSRVLGVRASVQRTHCVMNLKQMGLAFRLWAADHDYKYPMDLSLTNSHAPEWIAAGNAAPFFQVMSNELGSPKVLACPADRDHEAALNFTNGFSAKNISYFVGLDANDTNPQSLLSGDDNFEIGGVPVKPGLLEIPTNAPLGWTAARHKFAGNIGFADGSVQQVISSGLRRATTATGTITNRLLIP